MSALGALGLLALVVVVAAVSSLVASIIEARWGRTAFFAYALVVLTVAFVSIWRFS